MRFWKLHFCFLFVLCAFFMAACADRKHEKADNYFRDGEYDKAAKIYETIIKKRPDDIIALKALANIKLLQKDYNTAIANYKKVTEIDPARGAKELASMFSYPKNVRDIATVTVKELSKGKNEVINEILSQMTVSSQYVKIDFLDSLAKIGKPASFATEEIAKYLEDDHFGIRKAALDTLGKMEPNQVKETGAFEKIVKALGDENPMVTESAVKSLGALQSGANSAVPNIIEMLIHQSNEIKDAAKKALTDIGPASREAVPALVSLTDTKKSGVVRVAALDSLAVMRNNANDAVPALIPLLQDNDNMVKLAAVNALSKIGRASNESMPKLIQLLKDKDTNIRIRAVNELSELGKAAADSLAVLPALRQLAKNDAVKEVREEAKSAIEKISKARR